MNSAQFSEETDLYQVVVLDINDYQPLGRSLPEGFAIQSSDLPSELRQQERQILRGLFADWQLPYCGRLTGWRSESRLYLICGDQLAGGVYLCDRNEFDECDTHGQLHYPFMAPHFQGRGLHAFVFASLVQRAAAWGLTHIYINSDRRHLPEVYVRWGAKPYRQIAKRAAFPALARWPRLYKSLRQMKRKLVHVWPEPADPCR
jgi:GNAT superfamily N-acetyltransferase